MVNMVLVVDKNSGGGGKNIERVDFRMKRKVFSGFNLDFVLASI